MIFDDRPEEETSDRASESETEESSLNLLSITESAAFPENFAVNNSFFDIGSLSDRQMKSLRDTAALSNDHRRLFDELFAPEKESNDPFRQGPADLAAGKGNPEAIARNNIQRLNEAIKQNEAVPEKKASWQHGVNLRSLGQYEMFLGRYTDAEKHLKQSIDILQGTLPDDLDPVKKDKVLKEACFNYAVSLARPKGGFEEKAEVIKERQQADQYFTEALELSKKLKEPAIAQGNVLREKLLNQTMLTARHYVVNAEGKQVFTEKSRNAYRDELQAIIDSYKNNLDKMSNDKSNNGIAHRALLTGDLAIAETSRADAIGDDDAVQAETHFKETLSLWTAYKPEKDSTSKEQTKSRAIARDKTLVGLLPQCWRLMQAQGKNDAADEIEFHYQHTVDRLAQMGALP